MTDKVGVVAAGHCTCDVERTCIQYILSAIFDTDGVISDLCALCSTVHHDHHFLPLFSSFWATVCTSAQQ